MTIGANFSRSPVPYGISGAVLSLTFLGNPTAVLAHGGHGNEFQKRGETTQAVESIQVDAQTAKRLELNRAC